MLSWLLCRRNKGANGSRNVASSGKGSDEAFGTRVLFMPPFYHKTNRVGLVLCSLNPVIKGPAPMAMGRRRSSPDPVLGASIELRGGHTPGQVNFTRVGKALTSEGIAAKEPPPALLQIQPAGAFRDEHMVQTRVVCHPGTCLQAVMTTEVIRNHENVAGGIVRFNEFEQLDVVRRIA
jgi:hypothetical protein